MKKIKLSQGKFALVDDEDYDWLSQWRWSAVKSHRKCGDVFYAKRALSKAERYIVGRTSVQMHRVIINLSDPKTLVDHIDGDGLNNQRANLRVATPSENTRNRRPHGGTTFVFKGIKRVAYGKYIATITVQGKDIHLGTFSSTVEAAEAYNKAALNHFGEFAYLNSFEAADDTLSFDKVKDLLYL